MVFGVALMMCALPQVLNAQSTDQAFPTAVTSNEISGTIPARGIGDPRLTTYYFTFDGNRGDVFINVVTSNFNGAIDIFTAQSLEPRTKITIYADNPERETGRIVYQRRDERLILRIQGRTPNDDPATYSIKFAGSFAPMNVLLADSSVGEPVVGDAVEGAVRVNSAGSILPPEPDQGARKVDSTADSARVEKPVAAPDELLQPVAEEEERDAQVTEDVKRVDDHSKKADEKKVFEKPRVIITDDLEPSPTAEREVTVDLTTKSKKDISAVVTVERVPIEETRTEDKDDAVKPSPEVGKDRETAEPAPANDTVNKETAEQPNPLANVFLRVELKDGSRIERRMTEVSSVNVIEGVLTIVTSDGETRRISILDVLKMTIE